MVFMELRWAVACRSVWPPERKTMPGTAAGTFLRRLATVVVELVEGLVQSPVRGLVTLLDGVVAIDQDLGLDDGHQAVLLGERGVEGQRLGVGLYATLAGDAFSYGDNRPPLGEARPQLPVLGQPVAETV